MSHIEWNKELMDILNEMVFASIADHETELTPFHDKIIRMFRNAEILKIKPTDINVKSLTEDELRSFIRMCKNELDEISKREKCKVYIIRHNGGSDYAFKDKEAALKDLERKIEIERKDGNTLFFDEEKTTLRIDLIDKIEYDKLSDFWIWI